MLLVAKNAKSHPVSQGWLNTLRLKSLWIVSLSNVAAMPMAPDAKAMLP